MAGYQVSKGHYIESLAKLEAKRRIYDDDLRSGLITSS